MGLKMGGWGGRGGEVGGGNDLSWWRGMGVEGARWVWGAQLNLLLPLTIILQLLMPTLLHFADPLLNIHVQITGEAADIEGFEHSAFIVV